MYLSSFGRKVSPIIGKLIKRANNVALAFAILLFIFVIIHPLIKCEYFPGGFSAAPSAVEHCTCMGMKTDMKFSFDDDMPASNICLGIVTDRWKTVQGITLKFDVTPRATSALILGAMPVF